jgi:hypothetical protein
MRVDLPKMTHDPMRETDLERRLANLANAPRCGAKTRAGSPCRQAAVKGRTEKLIQVLFALMPPNDLAAIYTWSRPAQNDTRPRASDGH